MRYLTDIVLLGGETLTILWIKKHQQNMKWILDQLKLFNNFNIKQVHVLSLKAAESENQNQIGFVHEAVASLLLQNKEFNRLSDQEIIWTCERDRTQR